MADFQRVFSFIRPSILISVLLSLIACNSATPVRENTQTSIATQEETITSLNQCANEVMHCVLLDQADQQQEKYSMVTIFDNSLSMCNEQAEYANHLPELFNIIAGGIDAQFGIAVTDMNTPQEDPIRGDLLGDPHIIDVSQSNAQNLLTERVLDLGCSGSWLEQGMDAAYTGMIEKTLPGEANEGFLAPDRKLVVAIVSDERDQSTLYQVSEDFDPFNPYNNVYVDWYLSAFDQLLVDKRIRDYFFIFVGHNNFNGVPGFGCWDITDSYYYGYETIYNNMAVDGRARSYDICNDSWSDIFQDLGEWIFIPRRCIELPNDVALDPNSVVVYGESCSTITDFEVDSDGRRVCFAATSPATQRGALSLACGTEIGFGEQ